MNNQFKHFVVEKWTSSGTICDSTDSHYNLVDLTHSDIILMDRFSYASTFLV